MTVASKTQHLSSLWPAHSRGGHDLWMHSEGHQVSILSKDYYTEIGLGLVRDSRGRVYWTQVFGRPAK